MNSKFITIYLIIQILLFLLIKISDYYASNLVYACVRFIFIIINAIFATKIFIDYSKKFQRNVDLLFIGLWTTVIADLFLVLLPNIFPSFDSTSTLLGFSFFVVVQTIYAFYLGMNRKSIIIRSVVILILWALLIWADKFSISLAVGWINIVMLTVNVFTAWYLWLHDRSCNKLLFAIAISCFLICDYSIVFKSVTSGVSYEIFRFLVWSAYAPAQILIVFTYMTRKLDMVIGNDVSNTN